MLAVACFGCGVWFLHSYQSESGNAIDKVLKDKFDSDTKTTAMQGADAQGTGVLQAHLRNMEIQHASVQMMAIHARNIQARLSLQACGVFVGMALGFVGLCLSLLGAKGDMDLDTSVAGKSLKVNRMVPGVGVIVCGTVLAAVSITHTTSYHFSTPNLTNVPGEKSGGATVGEEPKSNTKSQGKSAARGQKSNLAGISS
jgi:hypothetical protein